jgi:hypothetical protein
MAISNVTLDELKAIVLLHPKFFRERYPMRQVNNIYFDTVDLANYYDALSGVNRRSKMRFRWYGEEVSDVKGSIEMKEKNGMLVSKTIQMINHTFDFNSLNWQEVVDIIAQSLGGPLKIEFDYACVPVIINNYYRYYYESLDGNCRITLDYKQRAYDQRIYSKPNFHFKNPSSEYIILELKADKDRDFNLGEITNFFPFRVYRNSKYTSGIYWI